MSFHKALEKLQKSKEFKEFEKKHKNAFLFSAFFTLNPNFEIETQQLDYFISKNKVATFFINNEVKYKIDELEPKSKISKLDTEIKIDIDKLAEIIKKKLPSESSVELNKVIAILQKSNEGQFWNIICFFSSFKMLKLHIDCFSGEILKSKESSILDFIQVKK